MATEGATSSKTLSLKGKGYRINREGLLVDPDDWDEDFAREMAGRVGIEGGITERQWEVILFIRRFWEERGSCKLAGISYKAGRSEEGLRTIELAQKSYRIDIWGFLLDPDEWDDRFALLKAHEMKVPGGLTNEHWRVLRFLRQEYFRLGRVPTLHKSCEAMGIDLEELEGLFPDGYHRGAVKIAGLPAEL